jgi:hypothetical protein
MKKINISLLCLLFFASSIHAQTTLACQFTNNNGFTYEEGKWKRSGFITEKPFFIKIKPNGIIDESSLKGVDMNFEPQCKRVYSYVAPELLICYSTLRSLLLNTKTLEGAISFLGGVALPNPTRDDMSISLFNCQSM